MEPLNQDRWSARAREALREARREAASSGADAVHVEHLMLGLMDVAGNAAAFIDEHDARETVTRAMRNADAIRPDHDRLDIPLHDITRRVIAIATQIASDRQDDVVGTGHLFFAMLFTPDRAMGDYFRQVLGFVAEEVEEWLWEQPREPLPPVV